jgi:hypothetical protein
VGFRGEFKLGESISQNDAFCALQLQPMLCILISLLIN